MIPRWLIFAAFVLTCILHSESFFKASFLLFLYYFVQVPKSASVFSILHHKLFNLVCGLAGLALWFGLPLGVVNMYRGMLRTLAPAYCLFEAIQLIRISMVASRLIAAKIHDVDAAPAMVNLCKFVVLAVSVLCYTVAIKWLIAVGSYDDMQWLVWAAIVLMAVCTITTFVCWGVISDPAVVSLLVAYCLHSLRFHYASIRKNDVWDIVCFVTVSLVVIASVALSLLSDDENDTEDTTIGAQASGVVTASPKAPASPRENARNGEGSRRRAPVSNDQYLFETSSILRVICVLFITHILAELVGHHASLVPVQKAATSASISSLPPPLLTLSLYTVSRLAEAAVGAMFYLTRLVGEWRTERTVA